jgi:SNF2 family DNA or RNA helicase
MTYTLHNYLSEAGVSGTPDWCKSIPVELPPAFDDPEQKPSKPRADQVVALHRAIKLPVFGLYNEPGTGKTVVAQALCAYWTTQKEQSVVVMPPILLYQFYESLYETFKGLEDHVSAHIFCQSPKDRERLKEAWGDDNQPDIILVSYEMYMIEYEYLKTRNVKIFDEAQNLKNETSKSWRCVNQWIEENKREVCCLLMTGTPAHTDLRDTYALTMLTNPGAYINRKHFERRHCMYENNPVSAEQRRLNGTKARTIRVLIGFKNVENLSKNTYVNAMRVTKDKVSNLQKPVVSILPVKLHPAHHALYKKLSKERILEIGDVLMSALQEQALRQKLLQLVTCPELFLAEGAKVDNQIFSAVETIIDSINITKTKIILFVNFRETVDFVAKRFEQYNPAILNGAVTNKEAQKNKFLNDPTCRMLVANVKSAGVGLNLQGVCHTAAFLEPTGVPGDFKQAVERLWRNGQQFEVNIYIIKALATISPRAISSMLNREELIKKVNRDSFSLLDELMRDAA